MATIAPTQNRDIGDGRHYTWAALANGDAGEAIKLASFGDRTVQSRGTYGVGGTVVFEGTNEIDPASASASWKTLTDPQGNALSFQANTLETVMETPLWVRPRVTAGDGNTALTILLFARRSLR